MSHSAPHCPLTQICPLPQAVPSAIELHAVVLALGWQLWQLLLGLACPDVSSDPAMKQSAVQLPAPHTSPAPQLVPLVTVLHAEVRVPGWQVWHALAGLA